MSRGRGIPQPPQRRRICRESLLTFLLGLSLKAEPPLWGAAPNCYLAEAFRFRCAALPVGIIMPKRLFLTFRPVLH